MRTVAAVLVLVVLGTEGIAAPAGHAEGPRLRWPLGPGVPTVTRVFDAPERNWQPGHRGVDLAGLPGQPVYAAGPGTVVFAGVLAGRPVVSVQHAGGLRTSYEPVEAAVRPGEQVNAGNALGRLITGHPGCPVVACLHWGAMFGRARQPLYVDPLGLLAATPVRLKPLGG